MMLAYWLVFLAALGLLGVVGSVLERKMTLSEGVAAAVLFGLFGYMQFHGPPGNSLILPVIALVIIAGMYKRNAPRFMRRVNERILENRARKRDA